MIEVTLRCDWCHRWGETVFSEYGDTTAHARERAAGRGWSHNPLDGKDFCSPEHAQEYWTKMLGLGLTPTMPAKNDGRVI